MPVCHAVFGVMLPCTRGRSIDIERIALVPIKLSAISFAGIKSCDVNCDEKREENSNNKVA